MESSEIRDEAFSRARRSFEFFPNVCRGKSPLYVELTEQILKHDNHQILSFAALSEMGQPPVNLFFAAVHFMLLNGVQHELRQFYPSVGGRRSAEGSYESLVQFCDEFRSQIAELITHRRVQTNEIGRCASLLPAFVEAARSFSEEPLHLIEIGPSLGLNLYFDHYRYEYTSGQSIGSGNGPLIITEVRGNLRLPIPEQFPQISRRSGIDVAPVDLHDNDAVLWIKSLIWADQVDRIELFDSAIRLARNSPVQVEIVKGDGLQHLPEVVARVDSGSTLCVFNSHAIYQMSPEWHNDFTAMLDQVGKRRDLAYISLEWLGEQTVPHLNLTTYRSRKKESKLLAVCDHHGSWIEWRAS